MSLEPRVMESLNKYMIDGDQIHPIPTFENAWAAPRHTVIGTF